MRILLLSMPWSPFGPSSQLGVLAGYLTSVLPPEVEVHTAHLFVHLAARVGLDAWETLTNTTHGIKVGNLLFQRHLFDRQGESALDLLPGELLDAMERDAGVPRDALLSWQAEVDRFMWELTTGGLVDWSSYDLVGFSTVFNQVFPSLALAKHVSGLQDAPIIVFGGVEVHRDCGVSVLERFRFVDACVVGRGELPMEEIAARLTEGRELHGIPGVLDRDAEGRVDRSHSTQPRAKALFGRPDYSEFFTTLEAAGLPPSTSPGIPIEASQGCYWRRCDFCGTREVFPWHRVKPAEDIQAEITDAVERYATYHIVFTDEAVPVPRLRRALENLEAEPFAPHLAYLAQIRASFGKDQIRALASHGLEVAQVGIESFSDEVLRRMDKGVTALENVRCLKWCAELGVHVDYNLILGYPFADDEDLERQARMFPLLWHLAPPQPSDFYVNRFSLLFQRPETESWGLVPSPIYNVDLFPDHLRGMEFIAYEPSGLPERPAYQRLARAMATWRARHRRHMLYYLPARSFIELHDRRVEPRVVRLEGRAMELYLYLDDIRSHADVSEAFPDLDVRAALGSLVTAGLVLELGGRYLALAPRLDGRVRWT